VEASGARHLILRTSWVYDAHGRNFFNTILKLARERETLRVIADQIGAPTYAPHLADLTVAVLDLALKMEVFPSGIYHTVHEGAVSWHGFAEAICAVAESKGLPVKVTRVEPIATADYPTAARRPLNSRLDTTKLETVFGSRLPAWRRALDECMEEWMASHP
jgi:dTDP-4-dehydrorhamnose reductase